MPKYWGIFSLGRFPEVGQKQDGEREIEKERLNDCNNNDQLRIANATLCVAPKATWAKITVSLFCLLSYIAKQREQPGF